MHLARRCVVSLGANVPPQRVAADGVERSIADEWRQLADDVRAQATLTSEPRAVRRRDLAGVRVPDVDAVPIRSASTSSTAIDRHDALTREHDEAHADLLEWCGAVVNGFVRAVAPLDALAAAAADDDSLVAEWRLPQRMPLAA